MPPTGRSVTTQSRLWCVRLHRNGSFPEVLNKFLNPHPLQKLGSALWSNALSGSDVGRIIHNDVSIYHTALALIFLQVTEVLFCFYSTLVRMPSFLGFLKYFLCRFPKGRLVLFSMFPGYFFFPPTKYVLVEHYITQSRTKSLLAVLKRFHSQAIFMC